MSSDYMMRQCRLQRGGMIQTAWIPEKFAGVGKFVKICGEDGWGVIYVGERRTPYSEVNERGRDYLRQREASDI